MKLLPHFLLAFAVVSSSCASRATAPPPPQSAPATPSASTPPPPETRLDQLAMEVVPIQHAQARRLADTVNEVFRRTSIRAIPDERTNSIVLQARPDELKHALDLISRLDHKTD